jgi:hypothetical protein
MCVCVCVSVCICYSVLYCIGCSTLFVTLLWCDVRLGEGCTGGRRVHSSDECFHSRGYPRCVSRDGPLIQWMDEWRCEQSFRSLIISDSYLYPPTVLFRSLFTKLVLYLRSVWVSFGRKYTSRCQIYYNVEPCSVKLVIQSICVWCFEVHATV